jgi:hypothetical protein
MLSRCTDTHWNLLGLLEGDWEPEPPVTDPESSPSLTINNDTLPQPPPRRENGPPPLPPGSVVTLRVEWQSSDSTVTELTMSPECTFDEFKIWVAQAVQMAAKNEELATVFVRIDPHDEDSAEEADSQANVGVTPQPGDQWTSSWRACLHHVTQAMRSQEAAAQTVYVST